MHGKLDCGGDRVMDAIGLQNGRVWLLGSCRQMLKWPFGNVGAWLSSHTSHQSHATSSTHIKRGRVELLALYRLATHKVMLDSPLRSYYARLLFFVQILASHLHSEAVVSV